VCINTRSGSKRGNIKECRLGKLKLGWDHFSRPLKKKHLLKKKHNFEKEAFLKKKRILKKKHL